MNKPIGYEEWDGQGFKQKQDLSQNEIEQINKDAEKAKIRLQEAGLLLS